MSRKSPTQPRRLYVRKGETFVLFSGRYFAAPHNGSSITPDAPVVCAPLPSDGGRARIQVAQGESTEVWRSFKLSVTKRAPKELAAPQEEVAAPLAAE